MTWKLRERTNKQPGTAEIWEAVAPSTLSNVTVTATRSSGSYVGSISVVAFSGAATTTDGAVGTGNGTTGPPTVSLTTTTAGSWVWGVGQRLGSGEGTDRRQRPDAVRPVPGQRRGHLLGPEPDGAGESGQRAR